MERHRLSEGMEVAVKPETGSRRVRSFTPRPLATILDLQPDPSRPDRVRVRWARGGTSIVRIHRLTLPVERVAKGCRASTFLLPLQRDPVPLSKGLLMPKAPHDPAATRTRDTIDKTVEFVRLGYHDCSLNFTVRLGRTDSLADVLNAAGGYNRFDPETVFLALADVLPKLMGIEFGREASPVMYLEIPHWSHQQMQDETHRQGTALDREQRLAILDEAVAALRAAEVDTVAIEYLSDNEHQRIYLREGRDKDYELPEGNLGLKVRGWWD